MRTSASRFVLLPIAIVLLAFFAVPLGFDIIQSLQGPGGHFATYGKILGDSYYLTVVGQTLLFGLVVTLLCILLGYPFGFAIARAQGWARPLLIFIALAPLLVNVVVRSFGWMVLLSNGGLLASICRMLGLPAPELMYNWSGVTVAMVHVLMPFMALSVAGAVETIDRSLPEAAGVLGATPWRGFLQVTLPLSLEGIISGAILTFTLAIGSFVTVMLLGDTSTMVLPLLVYQQLTTASDQPFAAALGVVLLVLVTLLLWLVPMLLRRRRVA